MPLFYVTGLSGAGKSAVLTELRARGCEAYGVDEDGYARWINRRSGLAEIWTEDLAADFHAWYRDHRWVLDRTRIAGLDGAGPVFLCGVAEGDREVWNLFDAVFALVVDWETLERRIAARADNQFGKDPAELAIVRGWHATYARTYEGFGTVLVDAAQPLGTVVDEILSRSCP